MNAMTSAIRIPFRIVIPPDVTFLYSIILFPFPHAPGIAAAQILFSLIRSHCSEIYALVRSG